MSRSALRTEVPNTPANFEKKRYPRDSKAEGPKKIIAEKVSRERQQNDSKQ